MRPASQVKQTCHSTYAGAITASPLQTILPHLCFLGTPPLAAVDSRSPALHDCLWRWPRYKKALSAAVPGFSRAYPCVQPDKTSKAASLRKTARLSWSTRMAGFSTCTSRSSSARIWSSSIRSPKKSRNAGSSTSATPPIKVPAWASSFLHPAPTFGGLNSRRRTGLPGPPRAKSTSRNIIFPIP